MIVVELAFSDAPERLSARPAHRARLGVLHEEGRLLMAGPLGDDSGALLIFREGREEVEELMREDPYYSTVGVRVVSLREWRPVVPG